MLPLLALKSGKYLAPPSFEKTDNGNLDLRNLKLCIEGVISEDIEKVDQKVKAMLRFVKVLEKRSEDLIYDLRKRTYIKQNEHLLDDSDPESDDEKGGIKKQPSMSHAESVDQKLHRIASRLSRDASVKKAAMQEGLPRGGAPKIV